MHEDAIVIGGLGVVGTATRTMLAIDRYYDTAEPITDHAMEELLRTEYIFLCLPTPTVEGRCDTSLLYRYVEKLGPHHTYIIRSTVIPGTARQLSHHSGAPVLSCPEFLTEATAHEECLNPDLLVLGGDDEQVRNDVWNRFFSASVPSGRVVLTDTVTAEFIKYAVNTFYASKVLFATALHDVARAHGVDYDVVRVAMYARKWIGGNHLTVPWEGKRGVRGKCLAKDLEAFAVTTCHEFFEFLQATNESLLNEG